MFNLNLQAFQVANLIREYTEVLQLPIEEAPKIAAPDINSNQQLPLPPPPQHVNQRQSIIDVRKTASRPQSMLMRPATAALVAPQPS